MAGRKTVVTVGCGCTGDLATWPAAVKIAVDPLFFTYQKLGILVRATPGRSPTVYLSAAINDLPLLDDCADVVLCRNALDHVPDPGEMLSQIRRILKGDGAFYLSVDVGGSPTPDEPTVFLADGRSALVGESFEILTRGEDHRPHSAGRVGAVRILASKRQAPIEYLDKEAVLGAYLAQLKGDP